MSEVKRYDAVHIRYEDNNIRYAEGCEVEVVLASDYAALEAECERLRDDNEHIRLERDGWLGRLDLVEAERDALAAEVERLREEVATEHARAEYAMADAHEADRERASFAVRAKRGTGHD